MFKTILEALSPAMATSGVQYYWKGNYAKSYSRLSKAQKWSPSIFERTVFEGYLGLSLFRLGKTKNAEYHLLSANNYLSECNETDKSVLEKKALLIEINEALNEYKT